jgi:hypothetical protein
MGMPRIRPAIFVGPLITHVRHRWLSILAPGVVFIAVRALGVLLLWWLDAIQRKPLDLHSWDGNWYLSLARAGYHGVSTSFTDLHGHHTPNTAMGFFPAYPALIRLITPVFFGHYVVAAIGVCTVAGVIAAYGVTRLARDLGRSELTGLVLVVLFAAAPMSIVYSMTYPEVVQCALTAWGLVGLVERRWLLAGWCAAMAGLVRPTAAPLILVVIAVAAIMLIRRQTDWTAAIALITAPFGLIAYVLWVGLQTGSPTGYFRIQQTGWNLSVDGGVTTARWVARVLSTDPTAYSVLSALLLFAALALAGYTVRELPWEVWTFGVLTVLMTVGTSGVMSTKPRELLPAFVLLIPAATAISRQHPAKAVTLLVLTAGFGLWFSAYGLTTWPYTI